ncbi:hypothetical protein C8R44DRAFT_613104, partial [Mycena epipterygia]
EERVECGMYDEIATTLDAMGSKALGNLDCPTDFIRYQPSGSTNIEFRDNEGQEFRTLIVGEIAGSNTGTVLRATGNYYAGNDFKPINDSKTGVKDILALVMPSLSTDKMANFWDNQTGGAFSGEFRARPRRVNLAMFQEYIVRTWMCSLKEGSNLDDIIMCHMLPKYAVSCSLLPPPKPLIHRLVSTAATLAASASGLPFFVLASAIKLGAVYDTCLISDYGGPYFALRKNGVVQLDVRDGTPGGNNALILPWDFYERLKPGTLVLVSVSLRIFIMNDTDAKGNLRPKKRKIYQINAHSIKVLADSDEPVESRSIMVPRNFDGSSRVAAPAPPEFSNFTLKSSPTKGKSREPAPSKGKEPASSMSKGKNKEPASSPSTSSSSSSGSTLASGKSPLGSPLPLSESPRPYSGTVFYA